MSQKAPMAPADEAEFSVIGAILNDDSVLIEVRELISPADFRNPLLGNLFSVICQIGDRDEPVDVVSLSKEIRGTNLEHDLFGLTMAEIADCVMDSTRAKPHADIVRSNGERQRRVGDILRVKSALESDSVPAKVALRESERLAVSLLESCGSTEGLVMPEDLLPATRQQIADVRAGKHIEGVIMTGWKRLDDLTGGFRPGQLILIAARPSVGKSSLMTTIAGKVALEDRLPVLLMSMEVMAKNVIENIITARAGVDGRAVLSGQTHEHVYEKWLKAAGEVALASILVDGSSVITPSHVRAVTRRSTLTERVKLVMVDYMQLMTPEVSFNSSREREVASISAALKAAAVESEVPVIALSQLNRQVENRGVDAEPRLADLRDSGSIEQDADVVIMIHTISHGEDGVWSKKCLNVAKNRSGPTGKVDMYFHKPSLCFTDVVPPGYTPAEKTARSGDKR